MSLFKKLFGGNATESLATSNTGATNSGPKASAPNATAIKFGRYTDCNKNKAQLDNWSKSLEHFKNKQYTDSFESLLNYIGDKSIGNVTVTRNGDRVDFELIQGSKIVKGYGDNADFKAEAALVTMESSTVPVMRKLMALNYSLMYSKFALKDNVLCMKFTSHALDASPNKLYYALRELAKKADQQDDLLIEEFSSLKEIDTHHIIELSQEAKDLRCDALVRYINETKDYINTLDKNQMSGGIAFVLLNLTYTLDYLIMAQGSITDSLEKIQNMFFAQNNLSTAEKNAQILEEFEKIANKSREELYQGLYDVKATFAIANPTSLKAVMDFMFKEREKMGWYRDNNYPKIVEAVYGYMISYSFFNFGMVYPITDLLNLAMHVLHNDYYKASGSKLAILDANGKPIANALTAEVNRITAACKAEYPHVMISTNALNFTDKVSFVDSLILQMDKMNLTKI